MSPPLWLHGHAAGESAIGVAAPVLPVFFVGYRARHRRLVAIRCLPGPETTKPPEGGFYGMNIAALLPLQLEATEVPEMPAYFIGYDLHARRDYTQVHELMAEWGAVKLLESNWLAVLPGNAITVRDRVKASLDGDDSVAVIEIAIGADWATYLDRRSQAPAFLWRFV